MYLEKGKHSTNLSLYPVYGDDLTKAIRLLTVLTFIIQFRRNYSTSYILQLHTSQSCASNNTVIWTKKKKKEEPSSKGIGKYRYVAAKYNKMYNFIKLVT